MSEECEELGPRAFETFLWGIDSSGLEASALCPGKGFQEGVELIFLGIR